MIMLGLYGCFSSSLPPDASVEEMETVTSLRPDMPCTLPERHTHGEVVIMLAFQASGTGSTPVQCTRILARKVSSHFLKTRLEIGTRSRNLRDYEIHR